jgi:WD40 repeat protein
MGPYDPNFGEGILTESQRSSDLNWQSQINKNQTKPVVVTGRSGSGKSSLLSFWARLSKDQGFYTVFVPVAPQLDTSTLRGLTEHIESRLGAVVTPEEETMMPHTNSWQEKLNKLLSRIGSSQRVALIIDDVDRLESIYDSSEMVWLPRRTSSNLRVLISCSSSESSQRILHALARAPRIDLLPVDGGGLRERSVAILEASEDKYGLSPVRFILSVLTCSRMGLSKDEIQKLTEAEIPAPVCCAILDDLMLLLRRSREVVYIAHREYRNVVYERYLQSSAETLRIHNLLATFFSNDIFSERFLDEAVWHWTAAGNKEQVESLLCDPWFVENKCRERDVGEVEDDYQRAFEAFAPVRPRDFARTVYLPELIAYARQSNSATLLPPAGNVPRPPESIVPRLEADEEPEPDLLPGLRAFHKLLHDNRNFLRAHAYQRGVFFQFAYNQPDSSIARRIAMAAPASLRSEVPLVLRRTASPGTTQKGEWETYFHVTMDQRHIVSCGMHQKSIKIWDANTASLTKSLERKNAEYNSCTGTPDGKRLLAGGGPGAQYGRPEDFALHMWDFDSENLLVSWRGHSSVIRKIVLTPDGRWCVTASAKSESSILGVAARGGGHPQTIMVWDLLDGKSRSLPFGHAVSDLALGADGELLAIIDTEDPGSAKVFERSLRLMDLTGREIRRFPISKSLWGRTVRITPDGRKVILYVSDRMPDKREFHIFDLSQNTHRVIPQNETIEDFEVSADCRYLVAQVRESGYRRHFVRIIDLQTEETILVAQVVNSHGFAQRGRWCVGSGRDGNGFGEHLHIYDISGLNWGPAVVTATRLFLHDAGKPDKRFSAFCGWCGNLFAVDENIVIRIHDIQSSFKRDWPPCLAQWQAEWNEKELETRCKSCGGSLRFNPFLVDCC